MPEINHNDALKALGLPPLPEGWRIDGNRYPKAGEMYLDSSFKSWDINNGVPWVCGMGTRLVAVRIPPVKKKRLMTPVELAGKWLHFNNGDASMVLGFSGDSVEYYWGEDHIHLCTVRELQEQHIVFSDTPTGERKSLEVEYE